MSLATRCPRCQTVFRVVPDQLRVSEGWVRCGRCSEVFNAARSLVDPSTGEARRAPIEQHPGPAAAAGAPAAAPAAEVPVEAVPAAAGPRPPAAPPDAEPAGGEAASGAMAAPQSGLEVRADPHSEAALDTTADTPADTPADAPADAPADTAADTAADSPSDGKAAGADTRTAEPGFDVAGELRADDAGAPAAAPLPSFLRRAERARRWRRPAVRAALAAGVLVAALALGAQWLFTWRDFAAARWPALQPPMAAACASLGCRLQPWRAIDALVVDSSGLVRVEKTDQYRLSVTLRNLRDLEVALPAFDLALTDTQGRLIARRVLRAGELGATGATLAPGGEVALQATLRVAAAPVAGYTIEIFHP